MSDLILAQISQHVYELGRLTKELTSNSAAPAKPAAPSNRKKLGKQEVKSIRDLKRIGCTNKDIADVFDIHPSTVSRTVRGIYWK